MDAPLQQSSTTVSHNVLAMFPQLSKVPTRFPQRGSEVPTRLVQNWPGALSRWILLLPSSVVLLQCVADRGAMPCAAWVENAFAWRQDMHPSSQLVEKFQ